jgi:hypothetical protein
MDEGCRWRFAVSGFAACGGVTVWGLVSGPCGGELVAVELAEVLGHHQ